MPIKTWKLSWGVLMLHDNTRPHAAYATRDTLHHFGWGVLDHPPYSPDLSPCDYHEFGPLKKTLKGRWFNFDEAVREAVEQWFIQQPVSFAEGITELVQNWDKCLNSDMSRTAIHVLSLWCSGCWQIHIVYVFGPLSMFHLNNPYTSRGFSLSKYQFSYNGYPTLLNFWPNCPYLEVFQISAMRSVCVCSSFSHSLMHKHFYLLSS
jgi:hypothetical protein